MTCSGVSAMALHPLLPAVLLGSLTSTALASASWTVPLSDRLQAQIELDQAHEVFSPGRIRIVALPSNTVLIEVVSQELALGVVDGKVSLNERELPYARQSVVHYEDFNFDGRRDLAIEDGQNSCYHGPSYQVWLARADETFSHSAELTRLAQEYCGLFQVDRQRRQLTTQSKSGCCWHQFSRFTLINDQPVPVEIVESDHTRFPFSLTTRQTRQQGQLHSQSRLELDLRNPDVRKLLIFGFEVERSGKQVALLKTGEDELTYVFIDRKGQVELVWPPVDRSRDARLRLQQRADEYTLSFSNGDAQYEIYDNAETGEAGVRVLINGRRLLLKASPGTRTGALPRTPLLPGDP